MILNIPSFERLPDDRHYVYHLSIQYKDWCTTTTKRYSEFLELHRVMKVIQRNTGSQLPKFPKKMNIKQFLHLFRDQDMENRRSALENYMKELEAGDTARHSKYFFDFIGLPIRYREDWLMYKSLQ